MRRRVGCSVGAAAGTHREKLREAWLGVKMRELSLSLRSALEGRFLEHAIC